MSTNANLEETWERRTAYLEAIRLAEAIDQLPTLLPALLRA